MSCGKNLSGQTRQKVAGKVSDREILPLVEQTLDKKNPREWYWALMDYGVMTKEKYGNPNRASAHYARQSPFKGSNREIRGAVIKALIQKREITKKQLLRNVRRSIKQCTQKALGQNLNELAREGFLARRGGRIQLAFH